MPEPVTPKRQVSFSVTQEEWDAIAFVQSIHGTKYDGVAPVLNDYSVAECVAIHKKAQVELRAVSA